MTDLKVQISWDPVPEANEYMIRVFMNNVMLSEHVTTDSFLIVPVSAENGDKFAARVVAMNETGRSKVVTKEIALFVRPVPAEPVVSIIQTL